MSIAEHNPSTETTAVRAGITPGHARFLLLAACLPLFFWALGHPPLLDPDEPVYAAAGRAMLQSRVFSGWWSPHYNGHLWFDKPPLTYWLIAASMSVFGPNEFAARLPSALCALAAVWATARLAGALFPQSRWAGIWAGVVFATSLQTAVLSRAAVTDMILTLCLTLALWGLWRWLEDERRRGALFGAGAAMGFAILTKGPVALILIGGLALFFLIATRQAMRLLSPALWGAAMLSLLIALPWYLSMTRLHGALFIQGFLEANNLTRYLAAEHATTASPFFFFPVLLGFIFPWSGALGAMLPGAARRVRQGEKATLYTLLWIVWVFVFFTASQTKLVTYIYPLYPLAAVLIGAWIAEGKMRAGLILHTLLYSVLSGGVAVLLPGLARHSVPQALGSAIAVSVLLGVAALGALVSGIEGLRHPRGWGKTAVFAIPAAAMLVLFVVIASARFWDEPVPDLSQTQLASVIKARTPPGETVRGMTLDRPSLVYYSERSIVFADSRPGTAAAMIAPPYPLCATQSRYVPELARCLPGGRYRIVSQSGAKFVLLRYQPPGVTTAR